MEQLMLREGIAQCRFHVDVHLQNTGYARAVHGGVAIPVCIRRIPGVSKAKQGWT